MTRLPDDAYQSIILEYNAAYAEALNTCHATQVTDMDMLIAARASAAALREYDDRRAAARASRNTAIASAGRALEDRLARARREHIKLGVDLTRALQQHGDVYREEWREFSDWYSEQPTPKLSSDMADHHEFRLRIEARRAIVTMRCRAGWRELKCGDPLVDWIVKRFESSYTEEAFALLGILPATFAEIERFALLEGWCIQFEEIVQEAIDAEVLPRNMFMGGVYQP
jgi:hypothetical protein